MTAGGKPTSLLRLTLSGGQSVFQLRQCGREVAAAVGLEFQDRIRVATALSDLGRILLTGEVPLVVEFEVTDHALRVRLRTAAKGNEADQPGWKTAQRLLDEFAAEEADLALTITVTKNLPPGAPALSGKQLTRLREVVDALTGREAADELRTQNEELLATLDALEAKRRELVHVNEELEETNRGVMALYSQLTEELEETNRGVVALYAELDNKTIELNRASTAKNRFWSNVSHEVRTPVNAIVGLARLLLGPGADPLTDDQRRQLELVERSGAGLLALVNELLDVAKAESGRLVPVLAPVDPRLLFAQVRDMFVATATSGVDLVFVEAPAATLVTDEKLLVHILRNLVSNSLKFTERGSVRVAVEVDAGGDWVFRVTDTGIGIDAEHLDHVFEEFHQVPNPLQARSPGTGLGLPYARTLAQVLGGSLELSSQAGVGTEVTVRLPSPEPLPDVGTVLVVTDDDTLRGRLTSVVAALGDGPCVPVAPADLAAAVTSERPGLVVLDLAPPEADALLDALVAAGIAVVALSAAEAVPSDDGEEAPVATLHKSRLSTDSVREAIRRALADL
ncbi:putative SigmaB asociated two-component system sensor protein [Actinokineospora spheciospongiae]|uniref:histidine kinase n=1 Tax=Actinokineospora spheciospongiae TaxID=909613 RepID=W7IIS0_9PSEU|nr:ATP-binding protein [Actinokineospora spheciospongiae]EWC60635.1 putative SigmaB asociated two-component system sensor protein [Actinokineospora spheciospongiae]